MHIHVSPCNQKNTHMPPDIYGFHDSHTPPPPPLFTLPSRSTQISQCVRETTLLLNEIWLAVTDRSVNLPILTTVPALISRSTTSKIKLRRGFSMLGTIRTWTDTLFVDDEEDDAAGDMDVLVVSVRGEVGGCCVDVLEKRRPRRADAP